jgi:aconitate decarboxylase
MGRRQRGDRMGSGARLLAPSAAYVNAYLVHSLEFDCIHEAAVVHSIATLLSTLFAWSERASKRVRRLMDVAFSRRCRSAST